MSVETAPTQMLSSRAITRQRRIKSTKRFVSAFAQHKSGVLGVVMLLAFVVFGLLAPLLFPHDMIEPINTVNNPRMASPSMEFWLGTDELGRSVLALLMWAIRPSLIVGISASIIAMILGTLIGISSGHFRNWFGSVCERLTDWFLVIPFIPLVIVLAAVFGQQGDWILIVVLGVTSWPSTARLVRAQTLSVEGRPYMERAKVLGNSDWKQMSRHVLPNVMPLIIANTTLTVAIVILSQTTLAFIGLTDPNSVNWGSMLDNASASGAPLRGAWWYLLPPGICVILVVLAFTLIGRALEVVLNPRLGSE